MKIRKSLKLLSSRHQIILLTVLFLLHFSQVLDFLIIMPLGPKVGRFFSISLQEFGFLITCYAFSAALCGLVSTFLIHHFDRKLVLLFCCAGFGLSALSCALSETYLALLLSRTASGGFGGAIGTVIFSIIRDVISEDKRKLFAGAMANAVLVVPAAGISAGLLMTNYFDWQIVFYGLALMALFIFLLACFFVIPMKGYRVWNNDEKILKSFYHAAADPNHLKAFIFSMILMFACFSVMPYISSYVVYNVGFNENYLPYIFLVGGMVAFIANKAIGKICHRYSEESVFYWISIISVLVIMLITSLPRVPLFVVLIAATCFMTFIPGRLVPANTMISANIKPQKQTAFSILNSSAQGIAIGLAALIAGTLMTKNGGGMLVGYDMVGGLAMAAALIAISLSRKLETEKLEPET